MTDKQYDVVLLTQKEFLNPVVDNPYMQNVLTEDQLLTEALEQKGLRVTRTFWDNADFNWESTHFALFRGVWDYFHRFAAFNAWLSKRADDIRLINPYAIIRWNMHKSYLRDLSEGGINIPPTVFVEKGSARSLQDFVQSQGWEQVIIKPAIAGGARHTYSLQGDEIAQHQSLFQELIQSEDMLIQQFQHQIMSKGEVSFMVFGGRYSHAVLKKAKAGDFRVQDDFGGSVHPYEASAEEIQFVEQVMTQCSPMPIYARVDVMWDNNNQLCLSELEMIEPELWFRMDQYAAPAMADAVLAHVGKS